MTRAGHRLSRHLARVGVVASIVLVGAACSPDQSATGPPIGSSPRSTRGTATGASVDPPATSTGSTPATPGTTSSTIIDTLGPKACALLTAQQIARALGFDPIVIASTKPNFLGGGYSSMCDFRHENDPESKGKSVRIFVFPPMSKLANLRTVLDQTHDVAGLTAKAFAGRAPEESGSGPNVIMVDAGPQGFSITLITGGTVTDADLTDLARPALANFMAAGPASDPGRP